MASSSQSQAVNVADLELPQLQDVRRQLEEVLTIESMTDSVSKSTRAGALALDELVSTAESSADEVQIVPRKCRRDQGREQECVSYLPYSPAYAESLLDRTILVPLTNSLYVPGKLSDTENVIVDVGTGYYVKKVCAVFYFCNFSNIWYRAERMQRSITRARSTTLNRIWRSCRRRSRKSKTTCNTS